jgi:hypothetical protein
VPGFHDDVAELSPEELARLDQVQLNVDQYKESIGVRSLRGATPRDVLRLRDLVLLMRFVSF